MKATTEKQAETMLKGLIEGDSDMPFCPAEVQTFEDAGILTSNKGLVVRMADGTEFQVTIVKSR